MNLYLRKSFFLIICVFVCALIADDHTGHEHHHGDAKVVQPPPKIYLDKSPRIIAYQLGRLENERLLLVERNTDDKKYLPVYAAILARGGMSPQHREESLAAIVNLNDSDNVTELLAVLETLDAEDQQEARTIKQLAGMLLGSPKADLTAQQKLLNESTQSENEVVRSIAYAGLVSAGFANESWTLASQQTESTVDWLGAVALVPKAETRASLRENVVSQLGEGKADSVRRSAIVALRHIPSEQAKTFDLVAPFIADEKFRIPAVRTLLTVPTKDRDPTTSLQLATTFVLYAEKTPAQQRTTNEFLDVMQLTDQLMARIPAATAKSLRARLREVTVRVVRIHTVEEEMRYDIPFFAVEAGRPVQVVLQNEDLMPHNLVITLPDKLKEVAQEGAALGPQPGFEGKPFVPKSKSVLFATDMVQPRKAERLTFTAPSEVGEYPFVCTFPRHWMRMYGVMVVVDDLDAWLKDPVKPKDPIGNNRSFVQAWTIEDFKDEITGGLKGRSLDIGRRLFTEATCAQCHTAEGAGGKVGPELTGVLERWKGKHIDVLQEILDPSHRIESKYAVHLIEDADGRRISGIIVAEDKESISILSNPEAKEPMVLQRDDIEQMVKTSKSMMPKALLDQYTKDEVFELLNYVTSLKKK